ncbi:MAG: DNA translocase FtsK [Solibacillus sp.]
MSWIKNKLNKLLNKDDEQYDDYEEYESQEPPTRQMREPQPEMPERKTSFRFPLIADHELASKQTTEDSPPTYEQPVYQPEARPFELPRHLQQPQQAQVYDVEVSGIRELLERRQRGRGQSNVIRSSQEREREKIVTRAEREILVEKPVRQERQVDQKFINPLENRKRFVPTEVPSPVHGFKQVTPIETLLKERSISEQKRVEEQVVKSVQETEEEPVVKVVQQPKSVPVSEPKAETIKNVVELKPKAAVKEPLIVEQPIKPVVAEPLLVVEEEPVVKEPEVKSSTEEIALQPTNIVAVEKIEQEPTSTNEETEVQMVSVATLEKTEELADLHVPELPPIRLTLEDGIKEQVAEQLAQEEQKVASEPVQVQHVTIENSTIHIEQLHVDKMPQSEMVQMPVTASVATEVEEETSEIVEQPKNEGTRLPFNVLMLKRDKQRLLAQQIAKEQFRQTKPQQEVASTTVEMVEEPVTQEAGTQQETIVEVASETVVVHVEKVVEAPVVEPEKHVLTIRPQLVEGEVAKPDTATVHITPDSDVEQVVVVSESVQGVQTMAEEIVIESVSVKEQDFEQLAFVEEEEELPTVQQQVIPTPVQEIPVVEAEPVVPEKKRQPYHKPPLDFLLPPEEEQEDRDWMEEQGENLVEALSHFQIAAQIESIVQGPAVTQFEITVGHGTKVSKVRNLSDDIKLALAAKDVRIDAPIPGKRSIGIEIPNRISRAVRLSEVTNSKDFQESDSPLEAALGLDLTGKPVTLDLRKMPHGLVAGATGSGKSVCINSILVSLLYKADPSELKLMLIDPKMVELAPFNHIPHLVSPVITDVKAATAALKWAVEEMERRYQLFMHSGQRHITGYNKLCDQNKQYAQKLPYMLIVIDELADLMMMAPQDVEDAICRIAQKARACGIHLIIATQRPSVDVITGLIKSNIPTRIAFAVSSQIDARTILDGVGAERLLGRGDMLYMGNGMSAPVRIQGTFVTDEEIEEIIEYVRGQGEPDYLFQQEELLRKAEAVEEQDELFEEVCRHVYEQGSASTSSIQRRYHIGYNRAARLVDMLERHGFVSEQKGSKPRDVFITETDLAHHFGG